MVEFLDLFGCRVRLTDERLQHIRLHGEMRELEPEIAKVLQNPELVRRSRGDDSVRLYYAHYQHGVLGGKWLCVVVKYLAKDNCFVITAYLTDRPKQGVEIWPTP
jgi:hypothetical protein